MKTAKVLSFETSELLRVEIEGKIYTLKTHMVDDFLKGLTLTVDELRELKKLQSDIKLHLIAKKKLNAIVNQVSTINIVASEQVDFKF